MAAFVLLALAALVPGRAAPTHAQRAGSLVMVIASSTGVTDVPSDLLRMAFLGLNVERQGVRLIAFNLPQHTPVRERLDRVLLGLEPTEVGSFWVDQRVRDGRIPPRTLPSLELALRLVIQLPGAVTCVPAAAVGPQLRALRIDGKGPTDSGYLLAGD